MSSTSTSDINLRQIIVPLDGSESSFQAARYAIKIAKMAKAEIIFMHAVVKPPYIEFKGAGIALMHYIEEIKKYAETWYKTVGEIASKEGVKFSTDTILDVVSAPDAIVNYAQDKVASVRRLHRTSLPIPHAGGTYPPKPPIAILGGILTFESEWNPPMGAALASALNAGTGDRQLDLGCIASHGHFVRDPKSGSYSFEHETRAATAFLFKLISRLQFSGTVPMIDVDAYAEWLVR